MMKNIRYAFMEGGPVNPLNERTLPETMLLIHFGSNKYTKNNEPGEFEFTEADADNVITRFEERGHDLVIDYEHQSLSGDKAPAAGWISKLEKSAEGLLAHIRYWTEEAQEYLLHGQYRYFSPTLYFSRSGKNVVALHSAALTNHPAMHGIPALVAADSTIPAETERETGTISTLNSNQEKNMNEFLEQLGLESFREADETQRREAVGERLTALCEAETRLNQFLKQNHLLSLADAEAKLALLHQQENADLVRQAFADGKLAESMRNWAVTFASQDPEAFSAWCKAAPRIVPDNQNIEPAAVHEPDSHPSLEEAHILRMLGITEEELKQNKNQKGKC